MARGRPLRPGHSGRCSGRRDAVTAPTDPASTYRLQLRAGFDLRTTPPPRADYLADLGVGALYARRAGRRRRAPPTATTSSTRPGPSSERGRRGGLARRWPRACAGTGSALVVDIVPNHMGVAVAAQQPGVVGRAASTGRESEYADCFDIDWDASGRSCAGAGRRRRGRELTLKLVDRDAELALLRPPVPDRARHRATARRAGARAAALPAGQLAAGRHRAELPAVLRRHHAGRGPGRGPGGLRGHPRRSRSAGCAEGWSTGCGSTTRTAWPTPAATCGGWPGDAPAAWWWWRRSSAPDEAAAARRWPVRRHHRLRRAAPWSAGCSSTRPGGALTPWLTAELPGRRICAAARSTTASGGSPSTSCGPRSAASSSRRPRPAGDSGSPADAERAVDRAARVVRRLPLLPARRLASPLHDAADGRRPAHGRTWPARWRAGDPDDSAIPTASWPDGFSRPPAMVMAKGVEDTAFYRYNRFVALNEVGGDPGRFGVPPRGVPRRCSRPAQGRTPPP